MCQGTRWHRIGGADHGRLRSREGDWTAAGGATEGHRSEARIGRLVERVPAAPLDADVATIRDLIDSNSAVVITDADRVVMGRVYASDLEEVEGAVTARTVMDPGPSTFRPAVPVDEMARYLDEHALCM